MRPDDDGCHPNLPFMIMTLAAGSKCAVPIHRVQRSSIHWTQILVSILVRCPVHAPSMMSPTAGFHNMFPHMRAG